MNWWLILTFLLFNLLFFVYCRKECAARIGYNTLYCVCNMSYCDNLDEVVMQEPGKVNLYETNKKGDRFKQYILKFTPKSNRKNETTSLVLTIDRSKRFQSIIGFGGAFTDASGINIKTLPRELGKQLLKDYFGETGIKYTMGRVPIGGCDFSTHPYTYDDNPDDDNLTLFSLQSEDFNYKIPFIKEALNLTSYSSDLRLIASAWSAPAWMKANNKIHNGGVLIGNPGGKYYKIWANYIVKFLNDYKQNGIDIWGMTIENEPIEGFDADYLFNSMSFSPETERDFIKLDLGPALTKSGYTPDKLQVMVFDDDKDYMNWTAMQQYANAAFNDPESAQYLKGIAYHCYGNANSTWDILDEVHNSHPTRFILSTECCQEFNVLPKDTLMRLGVWENSEEYAYDIMMNLQHWVTGWVEWNLALDMYGQPNWAGYSSESPIIINATAKEYYKDPKFYILGHYSKFLTPGSVRIGLNLTNVAKNVEAVAFERLDNSTVIIAYNLNNETQTIIINDNINGDIISTISAHSIQSYIWWN